MNNLDLFRGRIKVMSTIALHSTLLPYGYSYKASRVRPG